MAGKKRKFLVWTFYSWMLGLGHVIGTSFLELGERVKGILFFFGAEPGLNPCIWFLLALVLVLFIFCWYLQKTS